MPGRARFSKNPAMQKATALAIKMLNDPNVRDQLLVAGAGLAEQLRAWNAERRAAGLGDPAQAGTSRLAIGRGGTRRDVMPSFGQARLEERVDRLAETLSLLTRAADPAIRPTLDEVGVAVDRIRLALAVAKNLPLVKRKQAQREISGVLGQLEDAVMSAAMNRP